MWFTILMPICLINTHVKMVAPVSLPMFINIVTLIPFLHSSTHQWLNCCARIYPQCSCPRVRYENHNIAVANETCISQVQYIPRNMYTAFALLCFVVFIHWLIFPYPSGLLHWHCGNLTIAPVSAKQPWWIWINTSCEFIMKDCITTTKQSTTKPCAYLLGYTVCPVGGESLVNTC